MIERRFVTTGPHKVEARQVKPYSVCPRSVPPEEGGWPVEALARWRRRARHRAVRS